MKQNVDDIVVTINKTGIVSVDADFSNMEFVNLIGPALLELHDKVVALQKIVSSVAFAEAMHEAADKLQSFAASEC